MAESAAALAGVNGVRFGALTAVKFARTQRLGRAVKYWQFRCVCGTVRDFPLAKVRKGEITNCGCRETLEVEREFSLVDLSEYRQQHGKFKSLPLPRRLDLIRTEYKSRGIFNLAVTPFDLWLSDPESPFQRRHVRVIERAREMWRDIDRPRNEIHVLDDGRDGYWSERAKNILRRCKAEVVRSDWYIFENAIRWNEPLGVPGSGLMSYTANKEAAALHAVLRVAETISRTLIL